MDKDGTNFRKLLIVIVILCSYYNMTSQTWQWAKIHNSGYEGYAVCTDLNSNVYLAGVVYGTVATSAYTITTTGPNAILIKHDLNGNVLWVRSVNRGVGYGAYCDHAGNV